jgi:NAD(P)-dependent dehydrogenase (short-subunit alcohol dehydrogenase family)
MTPPPADPALPDLHGKVLLITGAGDGLGRATAIAAARQGAQTVLLGRTTAKLEATDDAIRSAGGLEAALYPLNLSGATWADLAEVAMTVEKAFGRLDALIHCAAHFKTFARVEHVEPKDWLESLQVNLTAVFALTRHCLPLLTASGHGNVVFVGDAGGRVSKPFQGAYGVSKAALETLCAQWQLEQPADSALRFHCFHPGPMRTNLRLRGYPGERPEQSPPPEAAAARLLALLERQSSTT